MFESSEYLADIITQCAFIEQKFCLDHDSKIRGHVETTMIKVYKAILFKKKLEGFVYLIDFEKNVFCLLLMVEVSTNLNPLA